MAKCYNAGDLRHKVAIQEEVRTPDGGGGHTISWSTVFEGWSAIDPASSYERSVAMQMANPITHKIIMRYDARIDAAKRILFGSRAFNIVEVLNIEERNIWMKIKAVEGQAT